MIAGALNFTLGLQANQFLNALGGAGGRLLAFTGIATSLSAAFHKMWAAIEKGGQLKDLAAAASLSVKDLYQLQRAFKDVGASAESVPSVINKLRRSLGSGEQNGLLASMGLDPATLAKANPAQQFAKIAEAMARLNVNARSVAATKIFGREGAQTIQQIANSGKDFAAAMKTAGADAGIWEKVAGSFDAIGDKVAEVQAHIDTMWALLAGALIQAFKEGKLAETLFDIFSSVFQALGAALPHLLAGGFVKLGELLLQVLMVPLTYLQTVLDASMQGWFGIIAQIPGLRDALGIPANFKPESWDTLLNRNKENGLDFFGANTKDMSDFAAGQFGAAGSAAGPILEGLQQRLVEMIGRLPQAQIASALGGGGGFGGAAKTNTVSATSIEKMGFIFNGRGSATSDYARSTAESTRQSARSLKNIEDKLALPGTSDFANQE